MLRSLAAFFLCTLSLCRAETYCFGDSLSDTGNAYIASGRTFPPEPYFEGRFSNGRVWVEHVAAAEGRRDDAAARLDGGNNYAVGGAETNQLSIQLGALLGREGFFFNFNDDDLVTLWIGGNDLLNGSDGDPEAMVERVEDFIDFLAARNCRRIIVNNLPDLSRVPGEIGTPNAAETRARTVNYNTRLFAMIAGKQSSQLAITTLDIFSFFETVPLGMQAFGFDDITRPAYNEDTGAVVDDPDRYAFWDELHPTAAVHRLIGQIAIQALAAENAFIPIDTHVANESFQAAWIISGQSSAIDLQTFENADWQSIATFPPTSAPALLIDRAIPRASDAKAIYRLQER